MTARCAVCGSPNLGDPAGAVLWPDLVEEWGLKPHEVRYIERQQGGGCMRCGSNFRSIALANALRRAFGFDEGVTLDAAVRGASCDFLEVNTAGSLTPWLRRIPGHIIVEWPSVDMRALPFDDESFDVVVHSDTLEHVERFEDGLRETWRVLRPGGFLAYTVPMIVERLSRSRNGLGLSPSYHGIPTLSPDEAISAGLRVHTEFGADAWVFPMVVGFKSVEIVSFEFPAALAIVARK